MIRNVFCAAAFALLAGTSQAATYIKFVSDAGDFIGGGVNATWQEKDGSFQNLLNGANGISIRFYGGENTWWDLDFAAPGKARLVPGRYELATRFPFNSATVPGLNVSGSGRGCNTLTGNFEVLEVAYNSVGVVDRFAAKFEQHCEGLSAALRGSVHFNSTIPATDLDPEVFVTVGGKNQPVVVKPGQTVNIDVKIAANGKAGTAAEHWIGFLGPNGNQWHNGAGWATLNRPVPYKIDWLSDGSKTVTVTPKVAGAYLFEYIVDSGVNNTLDAHTVDQIVIIAR